jgi:ribose 5-phosphate isomerase A
MNPKQRAAEAALAYVASGQVVGLGTGSTADFFLVALAAALTAGTRSDVRGVPTSEQSDRRARELGIPVVALTDVGRVDVTVDGADEVGPGLDLIKGLGGALLREKIVAQNSGELVIIADAGKRVAQLGTKAPLPVEVAPFAHEVHVPFFRSLGAEPVLRMTKDGGRPFVTDNGNHIYDCRFPTGIADPRALEATLYARAGVVHSGLFLGIASVVLVADDARVETLTR